MRNLRRSLFKPQLFFYIDNDGVDSKENENELKLSESSSSQTSIEDLNVTSKIPKRYLSQLSLINELILINEDILSDITMAMNKLLSNNNRILRFEFTKIIIKLYTIIKPSLSKKSLYILLYNTLIKRFNDVDINIRNFMCKNIHLLFLYQIGKYIFFIFFFFLC